MSSSARADGRKTQATPTALLNLHVTRFGGGGARVGVRKNLTWGQISMSLRDPSANGKADRASPPCWAFASFRENRRGELDAVHALRLDYEDNAELTLAELREAYGQFCYLAYTSQHHLADRPDRGSGSCPRWRMIIPLARHVTPKEHGRLIEWVRRRGGPAGLQSVSERAEQAYEVPMPGERYRSDTNPSGAPLDPDQAMAELDQWIADEIRETALAELQGDAPSLYQLYGLEQLAGDRERRLVSLARLPGWPKSAPNGHGWGDHLDAMLGGGLTPGFTAVVGSGHAGAGKSALCAQIADGLALRSVSVAMGRESGPLTPVLVCSHQGPQAWTWRSLARWTGSDHRLFRAGASAAEVLGTYRLDVERAFDRARGALTQVLGHSRQYVRMVRSTKRGTALLQDLQRGIATWRDMLHEQTGREVWPVVLIDPVQGWINRSRGEEVGLAELAEGVRHLADEEGWIVLMTSDTPTQVMEGPDGQVDWELAGVGESTVLLNLPDAYLYLREPPDVEPEAGKAGLEVVLLTNHWGQTRPPYPRYAWDRKASRFEALPQPSETPQADAAPAENLRPSERLGLPRISFETDAEDATDPSFIP